MHGSDSAMAPGWGIERGDSMRREGSVVPVSLGWGVAPLGLPTPRIL